jgi:Nitrate/nitrite transporter
MHHHWAPSRGICTSLVHPVPAECPVKSSCTPKNNDSEQLRNHGMENALAWSALFTDEQRFGTKAFLAHTGRERLFLWLLSALEGRSMKELLTMLRSGNWRALVASFLYFDTGFTVWLLYGPLAPYMIHSLHLSDAKQGFLVAVPILSAAILRVGMGNLYQSMNGRWLALGGVALSAIPPLFLLLYPGVPGYSLLIVLGVLLGVGGASFAVALPMAGSNYPAKVQGTVLGIAAAGNIGAVLDGFLFPPLAAHFGWAHATAAALPLLALAGVSLFFWGKDSAPKSGRVKPALLGFVVTLAGLAVLAVATPMGWLGLQGKSALLMLPVYGVLLTGIFLPQRYRLAPPRTRYLGDYSDIRHHLRRLCRHVCLCQPAHGYSIPFAQSGRWHADGTVCFYRSHVATFGRYDC